MNIRTQKIGPLEEICGEKGQQKNMLCTKVNPVLNKTNQLIRAAILLKTFVKVAMLCLELDRELTLKKIATNYTNWLQRKMKQ